MLPRRPERLKSFDDIGPYPYFLTFCSDERHRAFVDQDRVELVRTQISRAAADEQMALVAYCYMPDHLHLLVNGDQADSDCRAFIKRSKQLSGFYYQRAFGRRLWQRYGYEHVLRFGGRGAQRRQVHPRESLAGTTRSRRSSIPVHRVERLFDRRDPRRFAMDASSA